MTVELLFEVSTILAMFGWLALLVSPLIPKWSDRIAGFLIPTILSSAYLGLFIFTPPTEGGYGSLSEVAQLFSESGSLLAGWIHFLAFDLLIGAWESRVSRKENLKFWLVVPCLILTFLFGPIGFLAFSALRYVTSSRTRRTQIRADTPMRTMTTKGSP